MTLCFHLQLCSDVASLKHLSAPETLRIHSSTSHSTSFRCEGWKGQINSLTQSSLTSFLLCGVQVMGNCAYKGREVQFAALKTWMKIIKHIISCTIPPPAVWTVGTSQAGSDVLMPNCEPDLCSLSRNGDPVSPLQPLRDRFHMIPYYYGLGLKYIK